MFLIGYNTYKDCPLSCEKIKKNTNMLTLGQIKLYVDLVNKNQIYLYYILSFEYAKLDFCQQKLQVQFFFFLILLLYIYIKRSGLMSKFYDQKQNW